MKLLSVTCYCAIACIAAGPAFGHHHPPGIDESSIVKVEGVVIGTRWSNPHVVFWITVGEGNNKEQWLIEAPERDSLVHDGWRQPYAGERIVFYIHPHVDPNARYDSGDTPGWYLGAILSDGTKFGIASDLDRDES